MTRLTYAFVPHALQRKSGTVINISSVLGVAPEMLNGVYGATKAYVLGFTQSLQHELSGTRVRAQVVLPNTTATPFWDTAGRPLTNPAEVMSADDLVDAALIDLDRGELVSVPPLDQAQWARYTSAREALKANLGAPRSTLRTSSSTREAYAELFRGLSHTALANVGLIVNSGHTSPSHPFGGQP